MVGLKRDVLFAEKVVLCYRCKTRHMLGKNCPVVTPTTEDSGMSLNEQSDTPGENFAPVQPESSGETQLSAESQQTSSVFFFLLSFAKILHSFLFQLCKYLQGPAEDDCLIIRPFSASIYIYNTMYL